MKLLTSIADNMPFVCVRMRTVYLDSVYSLDGAKRIKFGLAGQIPRPGY